MKNYLDRKNFLFTNAVPETPKPKSAVPEMDIIPKTVRHKTFTTLATETKNLITAAQNGDKKALDPKPCATKLLLLWQQKPKI